MEGPPKKAEKINTGTEGDVDITSIIDSLHITLEEVIVVSTLHIV